MQGQHKTIGSLRETLSFNHGSTSGDGGVDQQLCWNNLQNPPQNDIPGYMVSSDETNVPFFNPVSQDGQNTMGWTVGESSSSIAPQKSGHGWSSTMTNCPGPSHFYNEQQYGSSIEVNLNSNPIDSGTLFTQGSSSSVIPLDLSSDSDDSDCEVMECTPYRPGSSPDGRRFCKRKVLEGHVASSAGSGSSNSIPLAENSLWRSVPAPLNMTTAANISAPTESNGHINMSEQGNPRLGLTIGTPLGVPASGSAESSHRNFRVRINGSCHQDNLPSNQVHANISSEQLLPELLPNLPLDLRSVSAADSGNSSQRQPSIMHVPSLHRNAHARLNSVSSSRTGSSLVFSRDRNFARFEEPNSSRNVSQHSIVIPPADGRNLNQDPANWSLAGGNIPVAGNVASASGNSSSSRVLHRSSSQYSRRLQELVRRSLLSSAGTEPGGHSGNSLHSSVSQGMPPSGNHVHRPSSSRSAMLSERHLDGAVGVPSSWRSLSAAREGRSRLVSEIRNALDLMRRGEGLRFEDVMMLDQSVLFGMPDILDRHRDMRLDVDNMTYEELIALEERIGDVCTGLSEETILSRLKQRNFICIKTEEPEDAEPCCICREEYNNGDDLGILDCGHDFHTGCIKQWLMHKNLCPICKTEGLNT